MTRWPQLTTEASWEATSPKSRIELARDLASKLSGFDASDHLVGPRGLLEVVHRASNLPFVAVPGGRFVMGIRDDEIDVIRTLCGPLDAHVTTELARITKEAPPQQIEVPPLLCARAPFLDVVAQAIDPRFANRCPLEFEGELPDLDALYEPNDDDDDGEEADLSPYRPAFLKADEASRALAAHGWRTLRASEWEYVARDLGTRTWIAAHSGTYAEVTRSVDDLKQWPIFIPNKLRDTAANELGVWALHVGEWVTTTSTGKPNALRGGSVLGWPWQDDFAVMYAHPAVGHPAGPNTCVAVRPALDLP